MYALYGYSIGSVIAAMGSVHFALPAFTPQDWPSCNVRGVHMTSQDALDLVTYFPHPYQQPITAEMRREQEEDGTGCSFLDEIWSSPIEQMVEHNKYWLYLAEKLQKEEEELQSAIKELQRSWDEYFNRKNT